MSLETKLFLVFPVKKDFIMHVPCFARRVLLLLLYKDVNWFKIRFFFPMKIGISFSSNLFQLYTVLSVQLHTNHCFIVTGWCLIIYIVLFLITQNWDSILWERWNFNITDPPVKKSNMQTWFPVLHWHITPHLYSKFQR